MSLTQSKLGVPILLNESINQSTAKQKYSFGKEPRFPSVRRGSNNSELSYNLPDTFNKRTTSFGVGVRFKGRRSETPSPGQYRIKNCFEHNVTLKDNQTAFSFGICRDAYKKVYNPNNTIPLDISLPGPGSYVPMNKTIVNETTGTRKFTLRPRTRDLQDTASIMQKSKVPGPGTYMPKTGINQLGKYHISTIPNSCAQQFSPSKRFRESKSPKNEHPGPGTYESTDYKTRGERTYFLSTFKNQCALRMIRNPDKSKRQLNTQSRLGTPGPGTYQPQSDFGFLESFRASPRSSRSPRRPRNNNYNAQFNQTQTTVDFERSTRFITKPKDMEKTIENLNEPRKEDPEEVKHQL